MRLYKWMTQDSSDWTTYTMKSFILFQNNFCYDGHPPIRHTADSLIKFAELEGKQVDRFLNVYKNIYGS